MTTSSNQSLWQVLSGRSAIREQDLVKAEVEACSEQLLQGLAHYKPPSSASEAKLKGSKEAKGKKLDFVLAASRYLGVDELQTLELFQRFLVEGYRGSLGELQTQLGSKRGRETLLRTLREYYHAERLHVLRCLKHLLGYWQDSGHPYREVYAACLEKINEDKGALIEGVWKQYEACARAGIPSTLLSTQEEAGWVVQNLREQIGLLEIALLYYKDFVHGAPQLVRTASVMQSLGFGLQQRTRASLVPRAEPLVKHLSDLCTLILVEAMDLEWIQTNQESPEEHAVHHLFSDKVSSSCKVFEGMISEWGDLPCHAPPLLAWVVLKYFAQQQTDIEETRLLGNRALQGEVFKYLLSILRSQFFSGDGPVVGVCKGVIHTLLSLTVSAFSEDSLGDPEILVAIAARTLTHPPLRLELWRKGTSSGVGLLLETARSKFPMDLHPLLSLLHPLSEDSVSARHTYLSLSAIPRYTELLATHDLGAFADCGEGESWMLVQPRSLFGEEARWLGRPSFTIPAGTTGMVADIDSTGMQAVVSWEFSYSGWDVLTLEVCSLLHCPGVGIDSAPNPLVERVTLTAQLVVQLLKHDWSLAPRFQPITSQYFTILQKFSPLPNPPSSLLAACLECVAVMAARSTNGEVWRLIGQTGFLPYLRGSSLQPNSVAIAPGHYGQILNVWERPRGVYPVSMAMLNLLVDGASFHDNGGTGTNECLACVVFALREMFAGFHKWRYRSSADRDELCYKLLQLCHGILSQSDVFSSSGTANRLKDFVSHFLLHTVGSQAVLGSLAIGVDTVNRLYNSCYGSSHPLLPVESLKLSFSITELLLQSTAGESPTPLEQSLATQTMKRSPEHPLTSSSSSSPAHLVSVIASYIHHRDDPRVPVGATRLLARLAQAAPMSMFACLGTDAVAIRDAYCRRLSASVEDTNLKVCILELIVESVSSQPGLLELFLCVRTKSPSRADTTPGYVLERESCLHTVLDMIDPDKQGPATPPALQQAAVALLRALWHGRHDAALIAIRSQADFWKNLTNPLFSDIDLGSVVEEQLEDTVCELMICAHVMHIVALETYHVVHNRMDRDLVVVLKEFAGKGKYRTWTECLKSPGLRDEEGQRVRQTLLTAQHQLAQAWKTLLITASSHQESVFGLSDSSVKTDILADILQAVESQLDTSPSNQTVVGIATDLSELYMILLKKWSREVNLSCSTISHFGSVLQLLASLDVSDSSQLHTYLLSALILLLRAFRTQKEHVEPRFVLGLIPHLAEILQKHHLYIRLNSKNRPEPVAVHLLNEIIQTLPDVSVWLPTLRQYSIVIVLVRNLDEHLRNKNDEQYIEAILSLFISLSRSTPGAEALVINGVSQILCISLSDAMATKLKPVSPEKQFKMAVTGALQTKAALLPLEWQRAWHLSLKLAAALLGSLGHQMVPHTLDFTGVYQERLTKSLDVMEAIHDLQSLEETRSTCQFFQQLAHYRRQWTFALPSLHQTVLERIVYLTSSTVAILSRRATLKHIVKTMNSSGVLPAELGPASIKDRGRVRTTSTGGQPDADDSWVVCSPALGELQDKLVSVLSSCLGALRCYTPPLDALLVAGTVDLTEYPPLFSLSLSPPTVDHTLSPSLGTLTACLTTGLGLMNKLDPHKVGTPSRSPSKSPMHPRSLASALKRAEYLCLLEQAVVLLLSQSTRYLMDPSIDVHDKQVLKKELANELGNFSHLLLLNFTRKGAPSPGKTPTTALLGSSLLDGSSGRTSSLSFSDTSEQGIFRLADSFAKHFFR